ncbi:MAG TPA: hypothetical protein PLV68_02140, partial [Ilumatobacteraceae bacterium]|nr:hypothetical protein [Ilumatobacteraceae bacterium]
GVVLAGMALVGTALFAGVTQTQPSLPWTGSKLYLGDMFWDKAQSLVSYAFFVGLPLLGALIVLLVVPMAFQGVKPKISAALGFALFGFLLVLAGMVAN